MKPMAIFDPTCRILNPNIHGRVAVERHTAGWRGRTGRGRTRRRRVDSPRRRPTLSPSRASKTTVLNFSSEAQTNDILCKPVEGQSMRFTRGNTTALRSWLLTRVPTSICLWKPFSCKACPGIYAPKNENCGSPIFGSGKKDGGVLRFSGSDDRKIGGSSFFGAGISKNPAHLRIILLSSSKSPIHSPNMLNLPSVFEEPTIFEEPSDLRLSKLKNEEVSNRKRRTKNSSIFNLRSSAPKIEAQCRRGCNQKGFK